MTLPSTIKTATGSTETFAFFKDSDGRLAKYQRGPAVQGVVSNGVTKLAPDNSAIDFDSMKTNVNIIASADRQANPSQSGLISSDLRLTIKGAERRPSGWRGAPANPNPFEDNYSTHIFGRKTNKELTGDTFNCWTYDSNQGQAIIKGDNITTGDFTTVPGVTTLGGSNNSHALPINLAKFLMELDLNEGAITIEGRWYNDDDTANFNFRVWLQLEIGDNTYVTAWNGHDLLGPNSGVEFSYDFTSRVTDALGLFI